MKALRIRTRTDEFRRAGRAFAKTPVHVPLDDLSEEQVAALKAESRLLVEEVEVEAQAPENREGDQGGDEPSGEGEAQALIERTETSTLMGAVVVVTAQLNNGYILVEHSVCPDADRYDPRVGHAIAMRRVLNRIKALESMMCVLILILAAAAIFYLAFHLGYAAGHWDATRETFEEGDE